MMNHSRCRHCKDYGKYCKYCFFYLGSNYLKYYFPMEIYISVLKSVKTIISRETITVHCYTSRVGVTAGCYSGQ